MDFGPDQLSYKAGFYKPTILKVHPPIRGIRVHARTFFMLHAFDPNDPNSLISWGVVPKTFES
jgi:hypothetical protein